MTQREAVEAEISRRLRVFYTEGELSDGRLKTIVAVSMHAYYQGQINALTTARGHVLGGLQWGAGPEPITEDGR